jgi:hypothetical protein
MCFHIGPGFVEALMSKAVGKSQVGTSPEVSDSTHPREAQEHPTTREHLASRLRAFTLGAATIKWLLFMLRSLVKGK